MAQREQWASRIGVILAVAGSAVGLGNFLRFPGQAAQNGGGAFMIPYFIALVVLGIPLGWAEWTMGRYGGLRGFNSAPGIFSVIWRNPLAKYAGAIAILIPLVIYMYYVVIEAWCLGYAWYYLTGDLMKGSDAKAYGDFFNGFVGSESDGFLYAGGHGQVFYFILFTFALNLILIYRGVSKGIETFCKYAMPVMALCAICVLIRVLTLGTPNPGAPDQSVAGGLAFMWKPQPEKLKDSQTWLAAAGQIFFSLSVGFGVIINYASYLKKKDDVALSGLTASSMNEFFEVCLGGLITLPAAFVFLGVTAATFGTFSLGFNALPPVFALMPGGRFFGFLWFFMLFLAAITSSVSMLQPVIAFFEEGLGLKRHASVAMLGLITLFGSGFVVYFSKDMLALDTLDFWVGTMAIFVLAMFQAVIYGWIFGIRKGHAELHEGAHIRVPWMVQLLLKYVTPVYLFVIFIGVCYQKGPGYAETIASSPIARLSVLLILAVLGFLLLLIHIAGKRWAAEGRLTLASDAEAAAGQPAPVQFSLRWLFSVITVAAVVSLLFAVLPAAWSVMIVSVTAVVVLCGYCLYRVLTLPPTEEEHLKAPLDIETGDTVSAD
jgi:neurotransmitter:Na+ symporter, NSS family